MDRRTFAKGALALPMALVSAPIVAQNDPYQMRRMAIGFAPPIGVPLTTTTETRVQSGKGGEVTLRVQRRFQFDHFGRGFRLVSTITDVTDTAPPRLSQLLRAGVDPLKGLAISFTVDSTGRVVDVEDLRATWAQIDDAIAAMADASGQESASEAPLLRQIATLDDTARRALLLNEIRDLLRYAGRSDVQGRSIDGKMASLLEQGRDGWRIMATVHEDSGLCWTMDKLYLGMAPPRHGVLGSTMQMSQ